MNQTQKETVNVAIDGICAMEEGGSFTEACRLFNEVYAFGKEAVDLIAEKLGR